MALNGDLGMPGSSTATATAMATAMAMATATAPINGPHMLIPVTVISANAVLLIAENTL